jgi:hypothetical protein
VLPSLTWLIYFHPVSAGYDRRPGEPDEETALQSTRDALHLDLEGRRVGDPGKEAVSGVVSAVGDEGVAWVSPVHPELGLAAQRGEGPKGRLPAVGLDLDRERAFSQRLDRLRAVGDDDDAARRGSGDDLLAQERPTPPLD